VIWESINLENCHFRDLSWEKEGGAINIVGGEQNYTIDKCTFVECTVALGGGAMSIQGNEKCEISLCCGYRCDGSKAAFYMIRHGLAIGRSEIDQCTVTLCSPRVYSQPDEFPAGAFLFETKPVFLSRGNITDCAAAENGIGSVFSVVRDELTASQSIFWNCGGNYILTAGSTLVEQCLMIAERKLRPCWTYKGGYCRFVACEFYGEMTIFECDGLVEEGLFLGKGYGKCQKCRLDVKSVGAPGGTFRIFRVSLPEMRSCPMPGMIMEKVTTTPVMATSSPAPAEGSPGRWLIGIFLTIAAAVIYFA
jgi:hypothetical protein